MIQLTENGRPNILLLYYDLKDTIDVLNAHIPRLPLVLFGKNIDNKSSEAR